MKIKILTFLLSGIALLIFIMLPALSSAQSHVTGYVTCAKTGASLSGAHVQLSPGNVITTTNDNGYFSLVVNDNPETIQLRVSHVGFRVFQMEYDALNLDASLSIQLQPETRHLQPVTVMAHHLMRDPSTRQDVSQVVFKPIDSGAFLRDAPNVSGVRRGGFGLDPVVRGNSGSRLNIRVDGLTSSAAACPNRMDPPTSHIRLSDIEKVEIHHGPHALQFGPSFGGTVNFVKQKPGIYTGQWAEGDIRTGFESNTGHQIADARLLLRNERVNVILSGGFSETSDYTSGDGSKVASSFASYDFGLDFGFAISDEHSVSGGWSQSFVRDADFPALPMDMAIDDTYKASLGYRWEPALQNLRFISIDGYYSFVDHEMNNHPRETFAMRDAVALAETRSQGLRVQARGLLPTASWNITANIDQQAIDGTRFVTFKMGPNAGNSMQYNLWQDAYVNNAGLYAGGDYFLDNWTLHFGARMDYNQADAQNPAPRFQNRDLSSEFWNFSASAGISRDLGQQSAISFYAGRGVRSPDVTERFINFLAIGRNAFEFAGNPDLKPEANHQADLVLDSRFNQWHFTLNGFVGYTQDYITAVIVQDLDPVGMNAPGVREFQNRGDVLKTGFETSVRYDLNPQWNLQWQTSYTFAEYIDDGLAVAEIPPFEQNFAVRGFIANRFSPGINFRHVAPQNRIDETFGEEKTSAFFLIDLHSGIQIAQGFDLTAGVRNLLDTNYEEHLNRNFNPEFDSARNKLYEPGRRVFIELSYRF